MPPAPLISHRRALARLTQLVPEADARDILARLRMVRLPKRGERFQASDIDELCAAIRAKLEGGSDDEA